MENLTRALRTALIILLLSVVGLGKMFAQITFTEGDLNYSVNDDGVSVTVTGHVDGTSAMGLLNIPASISHNGNSYSVTMIGYNAFKDCNGLTSVSFPNTLTSIGRNAFGGCHGFTSVTLPASLVFVGQGGFMNCSNIAYTNYLGSLGQWCEIVFESMVDNPITYSHNLFINGIELTDVSIPETTTHIENYVFWNCESLTSLHIPSSVTSIGYYAFCGCSQLQQITVAGENPNYDSRNDCNALVETSSNLLIVGSNHTIIPNTVTAIGHSAFWGCAGLESVDIPACMDSINNTAFGGCSGLKRITVDPENSTFNSQNNCNAIIKTATNTLMVGCENTVIPESVTIIGTKAFFGRTGLLSISIPKHVNSIESQAFLNCSGLNSVISCVENAPSLGGSAFYGVPCTTLIVPCGCVPAYEASEWHDYFTTIEEDCTGVEEDEFVLVRAFPNPTVGLVHIEAVDLRHISVFNSIGQQVFNSPVNGDEFEFDLAGNEAGGYLIRIEAASGIITKRMVLTK